MRRTMPDWKGFSRNASPASLLFHTRSMRTKRQVRCIRPVGSEESTGSGKQSGIPSFPSPEPFTPRQCGANAGSAASMGLARRRTCMRKAGCALVLPPLLSNQSSRAITSSHSRTCPTATQFLQRRQGVGCQEPAAVQLLVRTHPFLLGVGRQLGPGAGHRGNGRSTSTRADLGAFTAGSPTFRAKAHSRPHPPPARRHQPIPASRQNAPVNRARSGCGWCAEHSGSCRSRAG